MFLCFCLPVFSQISGIAPVSKENLTAVSYEGDASAPAAFLYNTCHHTISHLSMSRHAEYKLRIKIYTKEGLEYATRLIGGDFEIISAATYNLVNDEIVRTPLLPENIFEEEAERGLILKRLVFPEAREGCIIELHYKVWTPYFYHIPTWDFQRIIPVQYSELVTTMPHFFTFGVTFRGAQYIETKSQNNYLRDYTDIQTTYTARNLPAQKKVSLVNSMENYIASVQHELKVMSIPNFNAIAVANSWGAVIGSICRRSGFTDELEKKGYFRNDLKPILANLKTPEEKLKAVFLFVQDRVLWNKRYAVLCSKGVKEAYTNKSGNSAEINLMLVAMLRYAGIEAYPVLQCVRSSRISLYPSLEAFNYVTCAAVIGGKTISLDATSKWTKPGVLPLRAINWQGFVVKDNGTFDVLDVIPETVSLESTTISGTITPDGHCSGSFRNTRTDNNAVVFRELLGDLAGKEDYIALLEKEYDGIRINDYRLIDLNETFNPVSEEFSFTTIDGAEVLGSRMYISPLLFFSKPVNPFTENKREYPIDFGFPSQRRYLFTLTLPDGYTVESLPDSASYKMVDNIAGFSFNVQQIENKVQLMVSVSYNKAVIDAGYYSTLHDLYDRVIAKLKEKIVLKKG